MDYSTSGWDGVYATVLIVYVVLPSLLPALITILVTRLVLKKRTRLFTACLALMTAGLLASWYALDRGDGGAYFVVAYIVPALIINAVVLSLAGLAANKLVRSKA